MNIATIKKGIFSYYLIIIEIPTKIMAVPTIFQTVMLSFKKSHEDIKVMGSKDIGCGKQSFGWFDNNVIPIVIGNPESNKAFNCIPNADALDFPQYVVQRSPWNDRKKVVILNTNEESVNSTILMFSLLTKAFDEWRPVPRAFEGFTVLDAAKIGGSFIPIFENVIDA